LLSLYLQYIKGLDPKAAGLVLIAQPIMQAAFSPVAGRLSDRIEPRVVASAGMGIVTLGLVLLALLGPDTPLWAIVARLLLMGFGFALFSSPNQNAIMSSVERRFYGVASGMLGTTRLVGQMTSMGITALLFSVFIGHVQITPGVYPQFLHSMRASFLIFAFLCAGGVLASLARGRVREENASRLTPAA
jgi:MFS family permease